MSDPAELDSVHWLRAHANRDLTSGEATTLREFARRDASTAEALAGMDELHAALDDEAELFLAMNAPVTAAEESDASWQRLAAGGARAEAVLRAQLRFGETATVADSALRSRSSASRSRWWLVAGAAAALVVLAIVWRTSDVVRPSLIPTTPDERVLGSGARIVLTAELRLERPVLSWHAVVGATSYEAVILTANGDTLAQRADRSRASTTWDLAAEDLARVRAITEPSSLRLRVIARDSLGLPLATSGDLPLTIVE